MSPRLPPDPAEISTRSERSAFAEAIPPGDVTAPCRGPVLVCAYYDDPWKTPVTMAPLRITDMDGVVTDGEIRTQGLPSFGMQDGDDAVPDVYPELGRQTYNDAKRGPIVAALVHDPSAPAQIDRLEAQIIEDLRQFAANMDTALQPWVRDWENRGWWGAVSNLWEGARNGATAWWDGEGDLWAAIWDWISSLPELVGEAWDSLTDGAKALWENKEKILQILENLAKGAGVAVKRGLQALLDLLANFPDLKEITDTLHMLLQQSAEWMGALYEMARTQVPAVLAATFLSVVAATTPNFWTEMVGQVGGFILPEILIGILFGILATFTGGTAGPVLAARLTAFTARVANALDAAGAAGRVAKTIFTTLADIKDKMVALVMALKRNIAEEARGVTDEEIRMPRKVENPRTRLPRSNGRWEGEPGNGTWYPDNPEAKTIIGDKGVPFRDGRPDFGEWSRGNVEFEPGVLDGTKSDFNKVYEQLKEARGLGSNSAARRLLQDAGLTPHHYSDTVIQLIPSDLHNNIPHIGSASDMRGGL